MLTTAFSEPHCSAVSQKKKNILPCRMPAALSGTSKVRRGEGSRENLHAEYAPLGKSQRKNRLVLQAPLGETQFFIPQPPFGGSPMRSSEQGGGIRHLLARSSSSITREAFFRSHVDKLQQTALSAMISLSRKSTSTQMSSSRNPLPEAWWS